MKLLIWTDGASQGNPGPAGIGIVIRTPPTEEGEPPALLEEISEPIGHATCNQAEYWALIRAMTRAKHLGATELDIKCDSLVVVNQFKHVFKAREKTLVKLLDTAWKLSELFTCVNIEHIYDVHNGDADRLSKKGAQRSRNVRGGLKK